MVAFNHNYPPFDAAKALFSEEVLAEIADCRAHGKSWEETAKAVEWDAEELRKAVKCDPNFDSALERARCEVANETNDEGLARLRKLTEHENPETALRAHQIIREYLIEQQHNQTRIAVEQMRLQAVMVRAEAKSATPSAKAPKAEEEEDDNMTPEEREAFERRAKEVRERHERIDAEKLAREEAIVYLWGGRHKIDACPPDETDVPMYLVQDHTVRGRVLYWVLKRPLETDPFKGPFPAPEQGAPEG